jgi:hypothetical protein
VHLPNADQELACNPALALERRYVGSDDLMAVCCPCTDALRVGLLIAEQSAS